MLFGSEQDQTGAFKAWKTSTGTAQRVSGLEVERCDELGGGTGVSSDRDSLPPSELTGLATVAGTSVLGRARRCAESAGHNPDALLFTAGGPITADYVRALVSVGVTPMIVPPMAPDRLATFGEEVVARYAET